MLDRSERGKLALSGARRVDFLNGQVTNELAGAAGGRRPLRGLPDPQGQDARRPAGAGRPGRRGRRGGAALDTERSALQALFDMIRRFKVGYRVELHKRTLERGLLSLIGPAAVRSPAPDPGRAEHANAPAAIDGIEALAVRTDVGLDLFCQAEDTDALAGALRERGAGPSSRAGGRMPAHRARTPPLRARPGRHRDPPGGGAQRARRQLHQGLLRRPGDGRPPVLQGQAQPPSAGPAPVRRRLAWRGAACSASGRSGASAASPTRPALGPIGLALVRREAEPGATVEVGDGDVRGVVVELPFEASGPGESR